MAWDFETDPAFQEELDWVDQFVRSKVEPLDLVLRNHCDIHHPDFVRLVRPLQAQVQERKMWACHLTPDLGGHGYGQVKLALLNEILGRSRFGPIVFGCQAPDTGNAELLAHFGTAEQKQRYLEPLVANEIVSAFSMTEPTGGSDPLTFTTRAVRDGNGWILNGEKWFSSNARFSEFLIVMAVTDPEAEPYKRMSMFIVPRTTPGLEIVRDVGYGFEIDPAHAYVRYRDVRLPAESLLGSEGQGFELAQARLGGGRIHHAMRTVGLARSAFDMMCERAVSRKTRAGRLADKQMVQEKIADSWIELEQFRLFVLRTAWLIDKHNDYKKVRKDIAAVKAALPKVLHDIAARALHIHGSLGVSNEMPFAGQVLASFMLGIADGPTEVHKITVAKQVLRGYQPSDALFPDAHLPSRRERALAELGMASLQLPEMM
jgi:acyl-CoA dehydrogenase